ncbi:hypothetical protein SLUN_19240 [Streptomyces lunaelactis]|uniref:Uncharacterized protein n=1 Tax=Streptomyces lunaelactis TaxID=1535768 RepID=A0A2R4T499_9ACTN|nr:hypothetical protein SLUN_19240 [Streptomyces lunaelactis]
MDDNSGRARTCGGRPDHRASGTREGHGGFRLAKSNWALGLAAWPQLTFAPRPVKHCRQRKSQRPCGLLHRASGLLCTRQDSNLQPSDP